MIRTAPDRTMPVRSVGTARPMQDSESLDVQASSHFFTVEVAAVRLSTTPTALRARCRRHARRIGHEVVARLGAGVTAYKLGASWRLRIDPP
jgi:hypothetical protein